MLYWFVLGEQLDEFEGASAFHLSDLLRELRGHDLVVLPPLFDSGEDPNHVPQRLDVQRRNLEESSHMGYLESSMRRGGGGPCPPAAPSDEALVHAFTHLFVQGEQAHPRTHQLMQQLVNPGSYHAQSAHSQQLTSLSSSHTLPNTTTQDNNYFKWQEYFRQNPQEYFRYYDTDNSKHTDRPDQCSRHDESTVPVHQVQPTCAQIPMVGEQSNMHFGNASNKQKKGGGSGLKTIVKSEPFTAMVTTASCADGVKAKTCTVRGDRSSPTIACVASAPCTACDAAAPCSASDSAAPCTASDAAVPRTVCDAALIDEIQSIASAAAVSSLTLVPGLKVRDENSFAGTIIAIDDDDDVLVRLETGETRAYSRNELALVDGLDQASKTLGGPSTESLSTKYPDLSRTLNLQANPSVPSQMKYVEQLPQRGTSDFVLQISDGALQPLLNLRHHALSSCEREDAAPFWALALLVGERFQGNVTRLDTCRLVKRSDLLEKSQLIDEIMCLLHELKDGKFQDGEMIGWALGNPGWGLFVPAVVLRALESFEAKRDSDDEPWRHFVNIDLLKSLPSRDPQLCASFFNSNRGKDGISLERVPIQILKEGEVM